MTRRLGVERLESRQLKTALPSPTPMANLSAEVVLMGDELDHSDVIHDAEGESGGGESAKREHWYSIEFTDVTPISIS